MSIILASSSIVFNNAAAISINTVLTQPLHDNRTIEVTASVTLTLNADATNGWILPTANTLGSSLYIQCAAGVVITWAGTAVIGPTFGASYSSDSAVAQLITLDHSPVANTWIVTSVQIGVTDLNATDVISSRAIALADFSSGVLRVNSAIAVAITLPTVASLALVSTPGKVRSLVFQVIGLGIPTFAGATAGTSINGIAGPTTVLPARGAPVQYGHNTLTQLSVGSDLWSLE